MSKAPDKELSYKTSSTSKFHLLTEIWEKLLMPLQYTDYATMLYMSALEGKSRDFPAPVGAIPETTAYIDAL